MRRGKIEQYRRRGGCGKTTLKGLKKPQGIILYVICPKLYSMHINVRVYLYIYRLNEVKSLGITNTVPKHHRLSNTNPVTVFLSKRVQKTPKTNTAYCYYI